MEDIFDGAWRKPVLASDRALETELARLVDIHGLALIARPARLEAALSRACPDATASIMLLLDAATAGVAARLGEADDRTDMPALLATCVVALRRHGIVDAERARWAVHTWAYAFAYALPADAATDADEAPARSDSPALTRVATLRSVPADRPVAASATPPPVVPDIETHDADAPTTAFPQTVFGRAGSVAVEEIGSTAPGVDRESVPPAHGSGDGRAMASIAQATARAVPLAPLPDRAAVDPRSRTLTGLVVACVVAVPLLAVLGFAGWRWFASSGPEAATPETSAAVTGSPDVASGATAAPAVTPASSPASTSARPSDGAARVAPPPPNAHTAVAPSAPAIARVDVSRVVDGAPFAIVVRMATDLRDVVAIERVVRDTVGSWPRSATLTLSKGLRRNGDALVVPFRAIDAPARATIVLTAIGRDGTRSEPRIAQVVVAADDAGRRSRPAADPAVACTVSTCGKVVETSAASVDARTQSTLYEVVVELDDHRRLTFTAPWRPPTGTRMRASAGGTFMPLSP